MLWVAVPPVNVMVVAVPKLVAVGVLFVTVGLTAVPGVFGEGLAPLNVTATSPA